MDVRLSWQGSLVFEGAGPSGHSLRLDADLASDGSDSGARPMELIGIGLAGCTGMDVISILAKKKQVIAKFEVNFHGERATDHPKVFTSGEIEYLIHGTNVDEAAVLRAIELSAEKYCPAQAMLGKVFPIRLRYKIFDAKKNQLLTEGEYEVKTPAA